MKDIFCGFGMILLGAVLPLRAAADCIASPLLCQSLDGLANVGHGLATINTEEITQGSSYVSGAVTGECLIPAYCDPFGDDDDGTALSENLIGPGVNLNLTNPNLTINPNITNPIGGKSLQIIQPQFTPLILNPNLINFPQGTGTSCPDGEDVCAPTTVAANSGHCVVCLNPGHCGVPISQECPQPNYANAVEGANGTPTGQAQIAEEPAGGGHGGSYGGGQEGGSMQGESSQQGLGASGGSGGSGMPSAGPSGTVPVIEPPAQAYSPGVAPAYIPAPSAAAAAPKREEPSRGGPAAGAAAGGAVVAAGAGGAGGGAGRRLGRDNPGLADAPQTGGAGAGDWRRRAAVGLKRGDMDAAVQALIDGMDADAASRGGAAYCEVVARELLQAMGMDADAVSRLIKGRNFQRFQAHFEKALQARAKGDIDLARRELARALAELLGRRSPAWALVPLAALAVLAGGVFLLARRLRRRAQGAPA